MSLSKFFPDQIRQSDPTDDGTPPLTMSDSAVRMRSLTRELHQHVSDLPRSRRWLSAAAAFGMLSVCGPVIAISYVLVRLTSKGPGFYLQTRLGLNGQEFDVIKLRTMCENAEAHTGPVWAADNDVRVTAVGKWLRLLHIDELPQLINVLKGDMALVGPRPERPQITQTLTESLPDFPLRLAVRPGITGLAQINLPANSDLESARKKLALDLDYAASASLWLDLRIIAATAPRLIGCRRSLLMQVNRWCGVARQVEASGSQSSNGQEQKSSHHNGHKPASTTTHD